MFKGSGWVYIVLAACAIFFVGSLWLTQTHKQQPSSPNELLPLRTIRGLETSTLHRRYHWEKFTKWKGYCFYLQPELGCLISLQLAPNGQITIFRMNTLTPEPSLPAKLESIWFACDFIYGNEACAYKPLMEEFRTEVIDHAKIHYTDVNSFPVLDVLVGFFQSPTAQVSGVECRTANARAWKGATFVKAIISQANAKSTDGQKFLVPPTYLSRRIVHNKSDSKEINDSENTIYQKFEHAVMTGEVDQARVLIAQMEALGRHDRAKRMEYGLDFLLEHYPGTWKNK